MLEVNKVNVIFNPGTIHEKHALKDIDFILNDGDFVTIIGSNGAGKSTLFNAISGNVEINSGLIKNNGQIITYLKDYKRARFIGRLYQDPFQGTAPNLSIIQNLGLAYSRGKKQSLSLAISKKDRQFFYETLKRLDLGLEERMDTPVRLLSGGQRQALTLLMATVVTPSLLLLDEHTAALDPKTSIQIMDLTNKIIAENNITTMMITHNIEDAFKYGNKTFVMNNGQIVFVLEGASRNDMKIEDVLKLYSTYNIAISDVNVLKQE